MKDFSKAFRGSYTVTITPFTADGAASDYGAWRDFLDWQIETGVPGIIILGTTGEFLTVSDEERREYVAANIEHIAGRIPAMVGTMNAYTPNAVRYSREAQDQGAAELPDTIALARELKARHVDVVDCSSGGINGASGRAHLPMKPGYLAPYAAAVRKEVEVMTITVGLIDSALLANDIVARGDADLVAMGRGLLEDPNFPYHAAKALGHPDAYSVLSPAYAFFLRRRDALLNPAARQ